MKIRSCLALLALCAATCPAFAQAPLDPGPVVNDALRAGDPGYVDAFRCPGSYPDEASRREATVAYLRWARETHPQWRVEETLNYRTHLLEAHQCDQTLDDMIHNSPQPHD